jgi:hypothetical protein
MGGGGVPGPESGDQDSPDGGSIGQSGADTPGPEAANEGIVQDITVSGWPRLIRWGEFHHLDGRPENEHEDALVAPMTSPGEARIARPGREWMVAEIDVEVVLREQSWVVRDRKTSKLLDHEQGHFDIHGIIAGRDLVEEIKALRERNGRRLGNALRRKLRRAKRRAQRMTNAYDADTSHGQDEERQAAWERQIENAITNNEGLSAPD